MGVRFDADQSAEDGAGAIVQGVFVKEVACRVWRDVVLQCAGVELLPMFGHGDSEQIAAPAFANESAQTFKTRILRADMQIQAHGGSIVIDDCGVHLQRDDILSPILIAHVGHLRTGAGDEIIHATSEARRGSVTRSEMFDDRDLRQFISDQE